MPAKVFQGNDAWTPQVEVPAADRYVSNDDNLSCSTPQGPGRPRKTPSTGCISSGGSAKSRGRPRKTPGTRSDPDDTPRGPGRPRKTPSTGSISAGGATPSGRHMSVPSDTSVPTSPGVEGSPSHAERDTDIPQPSTSSAQLRNTKRSLPQSAACRKRRRLNNVQPATLFPPVVPELVPPPSPPILPAEIPEAQEPGTPQIEEGPRVPPPTPGLTPRSRTRLEFKDKGVKQTVVPTTLRNKFVFANACLDVFAKYRRGSYDQKKIVANILSSSPIKKARVQNVFFNKLKMSKSTIRRHKGKSFKDSLKRRVIKPERTREYKEKILAFLERDDNSRMTADKNMVIEGKQKRIVTDYVRNLHLKFSAEHPELDVCRTTFRKYKPKHISLSRDLKKRNCNCIKCENIEFMIDKVKRLSPEAIPKLPKEFCEKFQDGVAVQLLMEGFRHDVPGDIISYKAWIPVKTKVYVWEWVGEGANRVRKQVEKEVVRTLPRNVHVSMDEFKTRFASDLAKWRAHNKRVCHQFLALKKMREKMTSHDIELQLDFSENYTCEVSGEVQTAHFNAPQITLHPIVMRYKDTDDGELKVKSFSMCSELDKAHNVEMIYSMLREFWTVTLPREMGQDFVDRIRNVNYVSDSPFSQYRNNYIKFLVALHFSLFGTRATWNFLEAGHGKGACDGVGGTVKNKATQASKHGAQICDFEGFWNWCSTDPSIITFVNITKQKYQFGDKDMTFLKKIGLRSKPGITTLTHSVKMGPATEPFSYYWRALSCSCDHCMKDEVSQCTKGREDGTTWQLDYLVSKKKRDAFKGRLACGCRIFCMCADRTV